MQRNSHGRVRRGSRCPYRCCRHGQDADKAQPCKRPPQAVDVDEGQQCGANQSARHRGPWDPARRTVAAHCGRATLRPRQGDGEGNRGHHPQAERRGAGQADKPGQVEDHRPDGQRPDHQVQQPVGSSGDAVACVDVHGQAVIRATASAPASR